MTIPNRHRDSGSPVYTSRQDYETFTGMGDGYVKEANSPKNGFTWHNVDSLLKVNEAVEGNTIAGQSALDISRLTGHHSFYVQGRVFSGSYTLEFIKGVASNPRYTIQGVFFHRGAVSENGTGNNLVNYVNHNTSRYRKQKDTLTNPFNNFFAEPCNSSYPKIYARR